ncbi:MAG: hypothetical protein ACI4AM_10180, partial [Muribaculaceae bacterium]
GDSRAYLFNTAIGLRRISKDHSLVQSLVDNHKITDDEAFDSPQSNIITRCLSDSQNNAKPENAEPVELSNGDVVMLCSDGLCGMIRDRDIVQVMRNKIGDGVVKTVEELVEAAKRAGGKDNVTVVAASITNDKDPVKVHAAKEAPMQREPSANAQQMLQGNRASKPAWMWALIGALAMAVIGLVIWMLMKPDAGDAEAAQQDSIPAVEEQQVEPAQGGETPAVQSEPVAAPNKKPGPQQEPGNTGNGANSSTSSNPVQQINNLDKKPDKPGEAPTLNPSGGESATRIVQERPDSASKPAQAPTPTPTPTPTPAN